MRLNLKKLIEKDAELRIPIRGYEFLLLVTRQQNTLVTNPYKGLWVAIAPHLRDTKAQLRIPIRGYELIAGAIEAFLVQVTNPYKGLWVLKKEGLHGLQGSYESL